MTLPSALPDRPIRDELRAATREIHARLERRMTLMDGSLTRSGYRDTLAAFHGFYVPLEARMASAGPAPFDGLGGLRARIARLEDDLAVLGLGRHALAALPACTELPPTATASDRMGCWYVIEGSALGGRHIHRHVVAHLRLEGGGASFFHGGADTGRRWRAFLEALDASDRDRSLDRPRTIASAGATFRALHDWLELRGALR